MKKRLNGRKEVMRKHIYSFLVAHKREVLGFGVYYIFFTILVLWGLNMGWHLRLPVVIWLLFILLISLGGDENYAATFEAYRKEPIVSQEIKEPVRNLDSFPFLTTLFLVLPPGIFLLIDVLLE